ncbi:MAG: protein kinase [Deltaproteobacteria bacterium]|nr:protein kinase [Deltaproteobacteria bacterium]
MTGRLFWADESRGPFPEGSYELLCPLAVGTIGEIDLARAHGAAGFIKPVAIKRFRPELAADPTFRDVLVRDTKLAVRLRQPTVVPVLDLGRDGSELYVAMEFVAGVDVAAWLDARDRLGRGPLPHTIAAHVAHQVLEALEAAHELGLTHGDLAPHRVIVTVEGEVKVGGFGLSGCTHFVETSDPAQASDTADLMGVGRLLYEMITMRSAVSHPPPGTLIPLSDDVDLDAFLRQALVPRPTRRFSSATAMRATMAACLSDMIYVGRKELREALEADVPDEIERARSLLREASLVDPSGRDDETLSDRRAHDARRTLPARPPKV